jgi:hypothetical protein
VQQHEISWPYLVEQLGSVRGEHPCVMAGLGLVERAAGLLTVDLIVHALGEHEELRITGDHPPADRDIKILDVPDEHVQHLCHPTANRGRADVPDGAPGQPLPELLSRPDQACVPFAADNLLQLSDRAPRHLH